MKVLTIKEPFATLIKKEVKHIETRSWKTSYRGELYIQAGISKIRKEIKDNQIPEELMHECYCMAYDKEAGAQKKMEQAADQMAEAAIKGEDAQSFAEEYQAQKSNRRRYEKIMQQLDKIEKRKAGR